MVYYAALNMAEVLRLQYGLMGSYSLFGLDTFLVRKCFESLCFILLSWPDQLVNSSCNLNRILIVQQLLCSLVQSAILRQIMSINYSCKTGFFSISTLVEDRQLQMQAQSPIASSRNYRDKFGLDPKKLSLFVSDRAAVRTGTRNGVGAKLKQLNPHFINFHSICHRLALACTDSFENVS